MARAQPKPKSPSIRSEGQGTIKKTSNGNTKRPTNERILVAAAQLFSAQGFAGTSTRDIAERVGITQPGLYRHFETKDEILYCLAIAIIEPWAHRADVEKVASGNEAIRLARLVRGICIDIIQSPYPAAFLLTEPALRSPHVRPAMRLYRRVERTIDHLLSEGIAHGIFREASPSLSRHLIMSLTDLLILPVGGKADEKINHIVEFALHGVLKDSVRTHHIIAASQLEADA